MPFVMSVRQFFNARDNALRLCVNNNEFLRDFAMHTPKIPEYDPCRKSVLDLSNRMIYGIGSGRRVHAERSIKHPKSERLPPIISPTGEPHVSGRELTFLDPSVSFDDEFSFSSLDLIKASITTNGKVCGKFKRDLKNSLDKLKAEKVENYTQCLRGIDNLKQELGIGWKPENP